jgi:hypothetical protein
MGPKREKSRQYLVCLHFVQNGPSEELPTQLFKSRLLQATKAPVSLCQGTRRPQTKYPVKSWESRWGSQAVGCPGRGGGEARPSAAQEASSGLETWRHPRRPAYSDRDSGEKQNVSPRERKRFGLTGLKAYFILDGLKAYLRTTDHTSSNIISRDSWTVDPQEMVFKGDVRPILCVTNDGHKNE